MVENEVAFLCSGFSFTSRFLQHSGTAAVNPIRKSTRYQYNTFETYPLIIGLLDAQRIKTSSSASLSSSTSSSPTILEDQQNSFQDLYKHCVPQWLLSRMVSFGFLEPTPIQSEVLQHALPAQPGSEGKDLVIHAQTGSGKTLAYLLPAISAVSPERACVQALVIVPTQELGMQVYKLLRRLTSAYGYESTVLNPVTSDQDQILDNLSTDYTGADDADDYELDDPSESENDGQSSDDNTNNGARQGSFPVLPMLNQANLRRQKLQLRQLAPRIIVGNPHRVAELVQSGRLRLDLLRVLVVDEFDACLSDTATTAALQTILAVRNRERQRQTILASATVPQHRHFLRQCVRQRWTQPDIQHVWLDEKSGIRVPPSITHRYALCNSRKKIAALRALVVLINAKLLEDGDHSHDNGIAIRAIVFVMPSRNVDDIVKAMNESLENDFNRAGSKPVEGIYNDLSVVHRKGAVGRFRKRDAHILIGTDVAARGLDFEDVTHVIHFDLPMDADGYLHRAGRAGRLGKPGTSIVMVAKGEEFVIRRIANTLDIDFERVER